MCPPSAGVHCVIGVCSVLCYCVVCCVLLLCYVLCVVLLCCVLCCVTVLRVMCYCVVLEYANVNRTIKWHTASLHPNSSVSNANHHQRNVFRSVVPLVDISIVIIG